jgi:chorismate dehydratase
MNRGALPIRIGRISYTNVWPIFYYLQPQQFHGRIEMIHQVPSQLNRGMAQGSIDMGPISSFAYGDAYPNYVLYPDLSVSACGAVSSILLFHRKPLQDICNGKIALPTTSASSVNLLKIILRKFYGGNPEYTYMDPDLERMMEGKDAALLIGDDAIKAGWSNTRYMVSDLGERWHHFTGMWMSFAVWAIRKETLERHADEVGRLFHAFMESKKKAMLHPDPMIREARIRIGGTEAYWRRYFSGLSYDFGPEQWLGLETYFRYAKEIGLLDKDVAIELWSDKTVAQVKE